MATNHKRNGRHETFKETRRARARRVERKFVTEDIVIEADGTIRFVYSDAIASVFAGVAAVETTRASHVEPCGSGWTADMRPVGGHVLFADGEWPLGIKPFTTRDAALVAEREWIRKHLGL